MKEATKRGRGRPPKDREERAEVTLHVRFTAAQVEALDAYLERQRVSADVSARVTRSSFVQELVFREIGLACDGSHPTRARKGGARPARRGPRTKK
jgi:hypothetical protein